MARDFLGMCRFLALLLPWPVAAFFKGGGEESVSQSIFTALWDLARPGPVDSSVWNRLSTALQDLQAEDIPESRGMLVLLELLGSPSSRAKEAPPWGFVRDVRRAVRAAVGEEPRHVSYLMIAFLLAIGDQSLMQVTRVNMPESNAFRFDFDRKKLAELHGLELPRPPDEDDSDAVGSKSAGRGTPDSSVDAADSPTENKHVGEVVQGIVTTKGVLEPCPQLFLDLRSLNAQGMLLTSEERYSRLGIGDTLNRLRIAAWDQETSMYTVKDGEFIGRKVDGVVTRKVTESPDLLLQLNLTQVGSRGLLRVSEDTFAKTEVGDRLRELTVSDWDVASCLYELRLGSDSEESNRTASMTSKLNVPDVSADGEPKGTDESSEGGFISVGASGQIESNKEDKEQNEELQGVEYGWDMPGLAYWMSAMSGDVLGALAFEFYTMHGMASAPNFQALPGPGLLRNPLPQTDVSENSVSTNSKGDSLEKRCNLVIELLLPHVQVAAESLSYTRGRPMNVTEGVAAHDELTADWSALLRFHEEQDGDVSKAKKVIAKHLLRITRSNSLLPREKLFVRYLEYRFGIDVAADPVQAGKFLLSAAEAGEENAQMAAADLYAGSRELPGVTLPASGDLELQADLQKATYFWRLAARKGHPAAHMMLAQTYLAGKDPSANSSTDQCLMALEHCRQAVLQRHPTLVMLHALAHRAHVHNDQAGALVLYSLLSEAGSSSAARSAADLWLAVDRKPDLFTPAFPCPPPQGEDYVPNPVARAADCALAHYRRAGVRGDLSAMHAALAAELRRGDAGAAYLWADRAAVLGDPRGALGRTLLKDADKKPGAIQELQELWAEGDAPTRQRANLAMARLREQDLSYWRSVLVAVLVVTVTTLISMPLACWARLRKDAKND